MPYAVGFLALVLLWCLYKVVSGGNIASLWEGNDGRRALADANRNSKRTPLSP